MPPLTPANQLIRARNVTASEVAALLPCGHPYITREQVYDRIVDGYAPVTSQAMRIGTHFEAAVLSFAQTEVGFKARANAKTYEHPDGWPLAATPDAFAVSPMPWALVPERALVEIKMSAREELWKPDLPEYVEWQTRAQMAVMDRDVVYVFVLVAMRLLHFAVWRDLQKERDLLATVHDFWRDHITPRRRPEPTTANPIMPFSFDADGDTRKEVLL